MLMMEGLANNREEAQAVDIVGIELGALVWKGIGCAEPEGSPLPGGDPISRLEMLAHRKMCSPFEL